MIYLKGVSLSSQTGEVYLVPTGLLAAGESKGENIDKRRIRTREQQSSWLSIVSAARVNQRGANPGTGYPRLYIYRRVNSEHETIPKRSVWGV